MADENKEVVLEDIKEDSSEETKVTANSTITLTEEQLENALKDVEDFEADEDNELTMAELGEKLMRKNAKKETYLTKKEMKKEFSHGHFFNPDDTELTIDEENEDRENYLLIRQSLTQGTFLKGIVSEIKPEDKNVFAIILLGSYTVKIPVSEFMWLKGLQKKTLENHNITVDELLRYMSARRGSEVEFRVTQFKARSKEAIATRLEPLGIVGFANYVKKDKRLGRPRIQVGTKVPATVVAVTSSFVICSAFGAEFVIKDEDLEWGGITDIKNSGKYSIGDTFLVLIKEIAPEVIMMGKKDDGTPRWVKKVNVVASRRDLLKNPYEKYKNNFTENSRVIGILTSISREYGCRFTVETPFGNITKVFDDFPVGVPLYELPKVGDVCDLIVKRVNDEKQLISVHYNGIITKKEDRRK